MIRNVLCVGCVAAALAVGAGIGCSRKADTPSSSVEHAMPVVLSAVREMPFEERIVLSGDVAAKNTAWVSARIPGVLEQIFVEEGDAVSVGQPLFETDREKLARAVERAEQEVIVASASVRAALATVARVEADLRKAQLDFDRYARLYEQDRAVTQNALETQETRLKQLQAAALEAKASVELAQAKEGKARSELEMARKDLADARIVSPIAGRVSARKLEPGEMAGAGTPVLRIDDLSVVELTAYLPEAYYGRVVEGATVLYATVQGTDLGEVVVTTKNPTIHSRLRTFEIKALVRNPPSGVAPGARADLVVVLQKRTGLGVPRESVLRRGQGLALFTVRDGKSLRIPVETGLESDGWVEVRGSGLAKDLPVVRMGQDRLNDGTAVAEVKEGAQ